MQKDTVLVGFGVTGISAAQFLLESGTDPGELIVVDHDPDAIERAVELLARAEYERLRSRFEGNDRT
jgi:predicted O-methyltransferase YrrM